MAMKIRCKQCRKKISIDEAFAGGMCRCPYCKAIMMAPSARGEVSRAARPDRPGAPADIAAAPIQEVESVETVPLAKPVMVQGIVALVLSGLVVLLLILGVVLVVRLCSRLGGSPAGPGTGVNGRPDKTNGTSVTGNGDDNGLPPLPDPANPFTTRGLQVAGVAITSPVVYVLDASSGMRGMYDPAVAVMRYSIRAMGMAGRFNVIVLDEEGAKPLADAWTIGGEAGDEKTKNFLMAYQAAGASDLADGIRRAMTLKPKAVVVLTAKAVGNADELAQQAKKAGVNIFAVMPDPSPDAVKAMEKLTARTGGQCIQFAADDLLELLSEAPPLP